MHSMWHASECVGKTASSLSRLTVHGPGRPPVLRPCQQCGAMQSWTQMQSHICPPNPAKMARKELIGRILTSEHDRKRKYGTGSVFHGENGTWYGFLTVGKATDGKRIRKKMTGRSQEEVESK